MIIIALGANLKSPKYGLPLQTCEAALSRLAELGLKVVRTSRWLKSAPVPISDQPWFVNGVAEIETDLKPDDLLSLLHKVEEEFGRVRTIVNAPRVIDIDLIAYNDVISSPGEHLVLPHPRMHERSFVLVPLLDINKDWTHPVLGLTVKDLVDKVSNEQEIMEFAQN